MDVPYPPLYVPSSSEAVSVKVSNFLISCFVISNQLPDREISTFPTNGSVNFFKSSELMFFALRSSINLSNISSEALVITVSLLLVDNEVGTNSPTSEPK